MRPSGTAFWPRSLLKPKWSGSTPCPSTSPPTLSNRCAIISPRILRRRGTKPSGPSAKLTRPHERDRHAHHHRRLGLELGVALRLPSRRRRDDASSTHLTIGNRANRRLLLCTCSSTRYLEAGLKRLPWSVTCLSPARGQSELLATQNPDGSLVFSAVLKDEQGLLSFLLVPPSAKRTPHRQRHAGQDLPSS